MVRWAPCAVLWAAATLLGFQSKESADDLLQRIKARMRESLARVPDYTCRETIERSGRDSQKSPLKPIDTLRLEVGFAGKKEIFSWRGADRFEEKELADMIGAGTVGTGSFAIHATNVFLSDGPEYTYAGIEDRNGRRTHKFDYTVPEERSRYRIRVPPYQAYVAFHGAFWVDAETLDLIRLEVHAGDIPEELQLARASDVMNYARVAIGGSDFLLPETSELTMVGVHGNENRNVRRLSNCRQYAASSTITFEEPSGGFRPSGGERSRMPLPPRLLLELTLASDIELDKAALGDPVRAVLSRPVKDGDRVLLPEGMEISGRLVRLERNTLPIDHYVVGLQLDTLEYEGRANEFTATMRDAGPAGGLIRQAKRLDPTFDRRRRAPRLDILVREQQRGQGILHWEAKKARIPRGLRMRWQTEPETATEALSFSDTESIPPDRR
jgi:hypothetical protein